MSIGRRMDKEVVLHIHNGILLSYKKNAFESVLMRWMKLESIIQTSWSQKEKHQYSISSVAQSCLTLCDPTDLSTPDFHVHHQLRELAQTHVRWVSHAIQPFHPLSSPSPPAFNFSQHQGLFQWVSSSHQVAKVLELQLQHQSFQRIFRTDFL